MLTVENSDFLRIDFTTYTDTQIIGFVMPKPPLEDLVWVAVKPFEARVWILIGISTIAVICALFGLALISATGPFTQKVLNFQRDVVFVFSVLVSDFIVHFYGNSIINPLKMGQGESPCQVNHRKRASYRFVVGAWCMATIVLCNSYNGILTSFIAMPKPVRFPRTVREVHASPLNFLVLKGTFIEVYLKVSSSCRFPITLFHQMFFKQTSRNLTGIWTRALSAALKRNAELTVEERSTAFDRVTSGCCAFTEVCFYFEFSI